MYFVAVPGPDPILEEELKITTWNSPEPQSEDEANYKTNYIKS